MKQILYTSCISGMSVGGSSGFQIRAMSQGLPPEHLRAVVPCLGYQLPVSLRPNEVLPADAPVRLAWLNLKEVGHVLIHSVYVGRDPMTKRFGNFFSHGLLNISANLHAGDAIQTWGSDEWRRQDDGSSTVLPEIEQVPYATHLNHHALKRFLQGDSHKALLHFVLSAIFDASANHRIFLVAPPESVALCVYAVTRVAPVGFLKAFTFSTYEYSPLTCDAAIVATWFGETMAMELPSSCFDGTNVAFNTRTGKRSAEPVETEYVSHAIMALCNGKLAIIDKYRDLGDRYGVQEPAILNILFGIYQTSSEDAFSKERCWKVLANRLLAAYVATTSRAFLERLLAYAKEDAAWFRSVVLVLAEPAMTSDMLARAISQLTVESQETVTAWLCVHRFLSSPSLSEEGLSQLAMAVAHIPECVRAEVLEQLTGGSVHALLDISGNSYVQEWLERILIAVGLVFPGRAIELYCGLLRYPLVTLQMWEASLT